MIVTWKNLRHSQYVIYFEDGGLERINKAFGRTYPLKKIRILETCKIIWIFATDFCSTIQLQKPLKRMSRRPSRLRTWVQRIFHNIWKCKEECEKTAYLPLIKYRNVKTFLSIYLSCSGKSKTFDNFFNRMYITTFWRWSLLQIEENSNVWNSLETMFSSFPKGNVKKTWRRKFLL